MLFLLDKKSWHLYKEENVAKVREDERKAREAEEKEQKRQLIVESERRLDVLRSRLSSSSSSKDVSSKESDRKHRRDNGEPYSPPNESDDDKQSKKRRKHKHDKKIDEKQKEKSSSSSSSSFSSSSSTIFDISSEAHASITSSSGHINLFQHLESQGAHNLGGNAEASDEKKKQKAKEDDPFRLGGAQTKAWYEKDKDSSKLVEVEDERKKKKREAMLERMDPLNIVRQHAASSSSSSSAPKAIFAKPAPSPASASNSGLKSIEALRRERLEREKAEQTRVSQLIRSNSSDNAEPGPLFPISPRTMESVSKKPTSYVDTIYAQREKELEQQRGQQRRKPVYNSSFMRGEDDPSDPAYVAKKQYEHLYGRR